jgi:energy-coupling factor transporter ATP-binding protein EcfA2
MHSEGHQDSMGICLFLALSERLNQGVIDLSILDDVVMSVDSGHRKAFCKILNKYYSDKQFIITTHDTTWAVQLQKSKVIQSNQMLKLYGWSVDDGPLSNYSKDVWSKVQLNIDEENINDAAAKLRRGLEEWARMISGNLRAAVPYSPNDSGGLGDFMSAALSKYRKTLVEARKSASSWEREEQAEELIETISKFDQIRTRCNDENWVINPAVHYNEWESFTKAEFQEVFDSYKDMRDLLLCTNKNCGSAVVIHYDENMRHASIKCGCEEIDYSLKKR